MQAKTNPQPDRAGRASAMQRIADLILGSPAERDYAASIVDMGNGRVLGPEDVLEGHWSRLLAQRNARATRTVTVRVPDDLNAAIMVMAPELAPLTELAEEVADVLPAIQPAPQFRRDLYEALERTHRQQSAQRALGTRLGHESGGRPRRLWWALALLALGALVWMGRRMARNSRPRSEG